MHPQGRPIGRMGLGVLVLHGIRPHADPNGAPHAESFSIKNCRRRGSLPHLIYRMHVEI
jgi:hypothetical protein